MSFNQNKLPDDTLYTATLLARLLGYVTDLAAISLLLLLIFVYGFDIELTTLAQDPNNNLTEQMQYVFYGVMFIYYFGLETFFGKTLGKLICGTKVLNVYGEKPNIWQMLLRTMCRFIPLEALSFLFNNAVGLHDLLTKTRVIDMRDDRLL